MPEVNDILTIDEAAEILKISKPTLYRLVRTRKVPASRIGSQWRFSREQLEQFIKDPASFKKSKADA